MLFRSQVTFQNALSPVIPLPFQNVTCPFDPDPLTPPVGVDQVSVPEPLLVSTVLAPPWLEGHEYATLLILTRLPVEFTWNVSLQTVKNSPGVVVPIPTFPFASMLMRFEPPVANRIMSVPPL